MSRKLMCLINPRGKTPEEFVRAVSKAIEKYNETGEVTIDIAEPTEEWEHKLKAKSKNQSLTQEEFFKTTGGVDTTQPGTATQITWNLPHPAAKKPKKAKKRTL